jgi:hypothetical protein
MIMHGMHVMHAGHGDNECTMLSMPLTLLLPFHLTLYMNDLRTHIYQCVEIICIETYVQQFKLGAGL